MVKRIEWKWYKRLKGVIFVWTEEICQNITNELTKQLDDKSFFDAKKYYTGIHKNAEIKVNRPTSNSITKNDFSDIDSAVKGMAFSNKIPTDPQKCTVNDLSTEKRKIYKISDLLSQNLVETIEIPINSPKTCTSLAVVQKFDWNSFLFSDLKVAWKMVKNSLK